MCIGLSYHNISAQLDETIRINSTVVRIVENITHRQCGSRRKRRICELKRDNFKTPELRENKVTAIAPLQAIPSYVTLPTTRSSKYKAIT